MDHDNLNSLEPFGSTMYQCYWGGRTELGRFIRRFSLIRAEIKRLFSDDCIAPSDVVVIEMVEEMLFR